MSAFTWPPDDAAGAVARDEQTDAAVLVALYRGGPGGEPQLVLTRRRADLRRHAGEISFPGGRRDAEDADLTTTALREAEEEIGLERAQVSVHGDLPPVWTFATNYVIHPFIATIPAGLSWRPSASEVDAVLELPLAEISAGRTRAQIERRGLTFDVDAFIVDEHLIWGATARIIDHLIERVGADGSGLAELR